ncbi:MAG: response regulator [Verrucomicrobia bacterium]|nr:response regulator [Verrucomicrobiota bacterium]
MKKILVIDEDPVFRNTLNRLLSERGWEVSEAEDGSKGLEMVVQHQPRVVVCGMRTPGCNGYQLTQFIQGHRELVPATQVVVTTAASHSRDRETALEAGANAVLIKPIIAAELFKILDGLTRTESDKPAGEPGPEAHVAHKTKVRFWGVRGSLPTPGAGTVFYGGNTSCVEVRAEGQIIILDAGSGIRSLGVQLASEFKNKSLELTLLLTHTHWDHIHGFPFFAPAYDPKNVVRVLSYEGARRGLEATLSIQMESPYFPISLQQMPGNITIQELKGLSFKIGSVKVEAMFVNHPGVCVGYRLFTSCGSVAYLPDNELSRRRTNPGASELGRSVSEMPQPSQREDQKLIEFIKGAEVAIMDSQYDENEYASHVGWGHSCADDAVAVAVQARVKNFFLFHHDPSHNDDKISRMLAKAKEVAAPLGGATRVEAAREGLEIEF